MNHALDFSIINSTTFNSINIIKILHILLDLGYASFLWSVRFILVSKINLLSNIKNNSLPIKLFIICH